MAKDYFGIRILRGLDHGYVRDKDFLFLDETVDGFENIELKGRIEREPIEVEMTNKQSPKNSDPIAIDHVGNGFLLAESILVVLEELGFKDFKAIPIILNQKATKRKWNFWLFRAEELKLPLQTEVICFREYAGTMMYFNKAAKEKIEALNPNCVQLIVPYNIDQF